MSLDRNPKENPDKNALIILLRGFTSDVWKDFEKFIASPYFNKGRNYLPFAKILKKYHPEFDPKEFSKENIYNQLYPGREYKESVINSMFSRLYNLGEEFLIQSEFNKENNIRKECIAIKVLNSSGLKSKAMKRVLKAENIIEKSGIGLDFHIQRKTLNMEMSYLFYNNESRSQLIERLNLALEDIFFAFVMEFFHFEFSIFTQRNFWKSDYDKSFINKVIENINFEIIIELIKREDKKENSVILISYLMHLSIKNLENDDHYFELKDLVYGNLKVYNKEFRKLMLNILALICTLKFVSGRNEFKVEAFEIRKKVIEEDLSSLNTGNHFRTSDFRSVFIEALNLNQINWAKEFVSKYIERLSPEIRFDVEMYCKARFSYEEKDYDSAIDYSMKVNINQITFKLDMKNILAKIYYDTDSTESLYSLLNTYYQLVNNSELQNEEFSTRHFNFIKFLKSLLNIKLNFKDRSEYLFLKDKILPENVTAKSWLLTKIDEQINQK